MFFFLKNRLKTTNTTYDFNMIQFPDFGLAGLGQSSAFTHDTSVRASFQMLSIIFFVPRNFSSNAQPSTSGLPYFALLPISQSPRRLRHCFWSWRICVHGWWQGLVRHCTFISCHFLCHGLVVHLFWEAFWIHGRLVHLLDDPYDIFIGTDMNRLSRSYNRPFLSTAVEDQRRPYDWAH